MIKNAAGVTKNAADASTDTADTAKDAAGDNEYADDVDQLGDAKDNLSHMWLLCQFRNVLTSGLNERWRPPTARVSLTRTNVHLIGK